MVLSLRIFYIEPALLSLDDGDGTPVVGQGDENRVDVRTPQNVAKVFVYAAALVSAGLPGARAVPFDQVARWFAIWTFTKLLMR